MMTSLLKMFCSILALGVLFVFAAPAYPQSDPDRQAMIERHEKMAKAHQEMVKCLKSKKSLDECRAKMKESCPMMSGGSCPMMGEGAACGKGGDGACCPMCAGAGCGQGPGPHGKGK
ncbi:MAG: hypothetical protein IT572_11205 [Deltaproteobacteria bacterium]|nr:hypothetical protein [Deltaproteobacteria bacterium]